MGGLKQMSKLKEKHFSYSIFIHHMLLLQKEPFGENFKIWIKTRLKENGLLLEILIQYYQRVKEID